MSNNDKFSEAYWNSHYIANNEAHNIEIREWHEAKLEAFDLCIKLFNIALQPKTW
ncbi:hypothetical protein ACQKNX_07640 [Lysinibacillus sp. NPDC093712]|uniref:hypothetical protein n=1 Tax=Lysinibacillus sp. NPDC093712 TaxID=3390579 RepID=UPI003CFD63D4